MTFIIQLTLAAVASVATLLFVLHVAYDMSIWIRRKLTKK